MRRHALFAIVVLVLAQPETGVCQRPPTVELDTAPCVRPGLRPQVCARVFDDQGIARVRALFRASGTEAFYRTEMRFDGSRHCGRLPMPSKGTSAIDYYVEAVDNEYDVSRTREAQLKIVSDCPADPGPPPTGPTCVDTVTPQQAPKPPGFEAASVTEGC